MVWHLEVETRTEIKPIRDHEGAPRRRRCQKITNILHANSPSPDLCFPKHLSY